MNKKKNISDINPIVKTALSIVLTALNAMSVSLASKIFLLFFMFVTFFLMDKKIGAKKFKIILVFAFVSFFSNIFSNYGHSLFDFGFIRLRYNFVFNFLMMFLSMLVFWLASVIMINSISASDVPYVAEFFLGPLKFFKIDVSEISVMVTLVMRFVPVLLSEVKKVIIAYESRGASISKGSIIKRAKFVFPIFTAIFASCFRKAINIATAMECRCYGAPFKRTKLKENKIKKIDIIAILVVGFVTVGVIFCNIIKIF